MESKNFTIGVLSTTAVILLAALVVIHSRPDTAFASGMTTSGGDYVVTVGSPTNNDEELVYVVDSALGGLVIYRFDANSKSVEVVQRIDLTEMRRAVGDAATTKPPPTKKRGSGRRRGP